MTHLEKAEELRARTDVHFNCCQAVLVTFAQDYIARRMAPGEG